MNFKDIISIAAVIATTVVAVVSIFFESSFKFETSTVFRKTQNI